MLCPHCATELVVAPVTANLFIETRDGGRQESALSYLAWRCPTCGAGDSAVSLSHYPPPGAEVVAPPKALPPAPGKRARRRRR